MGSIGERQSIFLIDPYHDVAIAELQSHANKYDIVLPSDTRRNDYLRDATAILLRSETHITKDDLATAGPQLKYIIKQGVGLDNIDLEAAKAQGVKVFNTPGINSEAVAELTIGLALSVARRISEMHLLLRRGDKIVRSKMLGTSLYRKTIGIVGMGAIGKRVARKWDRAMEGKIIGYDPYAQTGAWEEMFEDGVFSRTADLDHLLAESDVVSLHVPETPATRKILSGPQFGKMRKGSMLLNCARGGLVDEQALLESLEAGHLLGAGLDAVVTEPPSLATYGETLMSHPRVIITPHVGASTEENQIESGLMAVRILLDLLEYPARAPQAVNM